MFASGSAKPNDQLIQLIGLVTKVVTQLPNKLSISGHTDSVPYRDAKDYTNWELSSDRANAARRLLVNDTPKRQPVPASNPGEPSRDARTQHLDSQG